MIQWTGSDWQKQRINNGLYVGFKIFWRHHKPERKVCRYTGLLLLCVSLLLSEERVRECYLSEFSVEQEKIYLSN